MAYNVLIDTNIWLDIILKREPFQRSSFRALTLLKEKEYDIFFTATTITDIYYVARKAIGDEKTRKFLIGMLKSYKIAAVSKKEIQQALNSTMKDFEDAIQASIGFTNDCEWLLTRNEKDFEDSLIQPITPDELINDLVD